MNTFNELNNWLMAELDKQAELTKMRVDDNDELLMDTYITSEDEFTLGEQTRRL